MSHSPGPRPTLIEPIPAPATPVANRSATLIESEPVPAAPVSTPPSSIPPRNSEVRKALPYRPSLRPPMAILTVFDDGSDEGETVRIRGDRFVIGRAEGDLILPHDNRVSSRHLEITRRPINGRFHWFLTDLQSTNGLFVRVRRALLIDGSEFLVGGGRYRFSMPNTGPAEPTDRGQTIGWHDPTSTSTSASRSPSLIELIGADEGDRFLLMRPESWIGTDPHCPVCRADDSFCEPKHARVHRAATGDWAVEHNRTLNGLWLRMYHVEVDGLVHFQIGEQRLRLKIS